MSKRIILLSDGTGNSAGKVWRTNVWRVFESVDLSSSDQVAFYDDGVGTSSFKPLAVIGGAFGYGLKRNVLDLYKFVCRNYRTADENRNHESRAGTGTPKETDFKDDEVYGFGFSRGAFTMRVVVALIADQGLVRYEFESELEEKARAAYRAFRSEHFHSLFRIEDVFRASRSVFVPGSHDKNERPVSKIRFLGVWDTVAAYGLPVDEWTRGISKWYWPLDLPSRRLSDKVDRACHAICLDDERTTFHPVLWDEAHQTDPQGEKWPIESQRISQVWFAGVHSNVGGGYPDDSLAHVPLIWMMNEAEKAGLRFKRPPYSDIDAVKLAASFSDKDGRLYDSRSGLGGYYRYGPRKVRDFCNVRLSRYPDDKVEIRLPKIHESVFGRIGVGAHLYAPIGIPPEYAVATTSGHVVPRAAVAETDEERDARCVGQESVWNFVWRRRVTYFLTVIASVHLILYPLYRPTYPAQELESPLRLVSDLVRLLSAFLPSAASRWIDAYARDPGWFLVSAALVAFLIGYGSSLGTTINDRMRRIWNREASGLVARRRGTSFFWKVFIVLLCYVALYPLLVAYGPHWLTLPGKLHVYFTKYTAQPVRLLAVMFLLVSYLPESFIQWLRELAAYKASIKWMKMVVLPFFFAMLTAWYAVALTSHFLFSARDSAGSFCVDAKSNEVTEPPFCRNENLAQCDSSKAGTSPPPALTCTPACSPHLISVEFSTAKGLLDNRKLCHTAKVSLEGGRSYLVTVERQSGERWLFWDEKSHTYGISMVEMPKWKRVVMLLFYPLRRSLDRPWGSLIARFGSTGNEESFMDSDPVPVPDERLGEIMTPKKDGQLFFYLNEPVVGFWGIESLVANWLGISAPARITIKRTK